MLGRRNFPLFIKLLGVSDPYIPLGFLSLEYGCTKTAMKAYGLCFFDTLFCFGVFVQNGDKSSCNIKLLSLSHESIEYGESLIT